MLYLDAVVSQVLSFIFIFHIVCSLPLHEKKTKHMGFYERENQSSCPRIIFFTRAENTIRKFLYWVLVRTRWIIHTSDFVGLFWLTMGALLYRKMQFYYIMTCSYVINSRNITLGCTRLAILHLILQTWIKLPSFIVRRENITLLNCLCNPE